MALPSYQAFCEYLRKHTPHETLKVSIKIHRVPGSSTGVNQMKILLLLTFIFSGQLAIALETSTGCPMCGSMRMGDAVLVLAVIAVLVSLSVLLVWGAESRKPLKLSTP